MDLNGYQKVAETLVEVGRRFQLTEAPIDPKECKSVSELYKAAGSRQQLLFGFDHVDECPRCQSWYELFRSYRAITSLPSIWSHSFHINTPCSEEAYSQTLATIDLCNRQLEKKEDEINWRPSPTKIRINLVIDSELGIVCLTLLEVPTVTKRISVRVRDHLVELQAAEPVGTFEFIYEDESICADRLAEPCMEFVQRIFGSDQILIQFEQGQLEQKWIDSLPIEALLRELNAFENDCEYLLPSGLACDTHVNIAKLCHYEPLLDRLAGEIDRILPKHVDVIVSNGWAMAMIARRIARLRNRRLKRAHVIDVLCEGYLLPVLTDSIPIGSQVAIITDVVVTGTQIERIRGQIVGQGSWAVSTATIVLSHELPDVSAVQYLVKLDLGIHSESIEGQTKPKMHFNPLSNTMTFKKTNPRAPSEFLRESDEANQLWSFLDRVVNETKSSGVQYYKRHHIDGNTHYTQFIDTGKLLQHHVFGAEIVEGVRDRLATRQLVPDVLLFPERKRARLFAEQLRHSFEMTVGSSLPLVPVSKDETGHWQFTAEVRRQLKGKFVLIVDTGVGHGKTIDLFGMAAGESRASRVGVAVILSRLPESAESAFADRFSGGFVRLFNLPVRPVVIRGTSKESCPYCQRIEAVKSAANESGSEAIVQLSKLRKRIIVMEDEANENNIAPPIQLSMFHDDKANSFLEQCSASIASGVTLHSLYAARNNGMASLSLPELRNERIPIKNREAMIADLPVGSVQWSQGDLDNDLLTLLEHTDAPSVWSAAAFALASERYSEWFEKLSSLMERSQRIREQDNPVFWRRLICSAFMTAKTLGELHIDSLTCYLRGLSTEYRHTSAATEIQKMLGVASGTLAEPTEIFEPEGSLVERIWQE